METFVIAKKYVYLPIGLLIFLGLYLTSLYNYLLFHSFAEIFSIVVACGIFVIAWNSRRFLNNNYLLFIGIAYLFVAALDLIHTLSYTGMGVFKGYETNLPTQLWIAARYMESLSLFIAPLFFRQKLKINLIFLGYALATSILLVSISYWNIFPVCFVEGSGLTPFKKISEYIISLILLVSIFLLLKKRREFDRGVLKWIIWSIILTIVSELAFTYYIDAYGLPNLIGHYFKVLSFYFIYKAIIETGFIKPYNLLFRNLKQAEERFRNLFEQSPIAIEVYDPVGQLLEVNKACLEIFGVSDVAEVKGFKLFDDPNLADEAKEKLKKGEVVRYEAPFHFEKVREHKLYPTTKSGTIYLDILITPLGLSGKEAQGGYLVQVQDITERKRMEEALAQLASFPELNPNPIVEVDLNGHIYYLNPATKQLFPDIHATGFIHPWLVDLESLGARLKSEKKDSHSREIKIGDTWYEQVFSCGLENNRIRIYSLDITKRKQAEEALRKIEWLLTKSSKPVSLPNKLKESYQQPYGNLVELNTNRILTDWVGEDVLIDIVDDFLDLLGTSAAIYEKSGDYALGIFASSWCRHLDQASRNLWSTDDNKEALESGKWHCHESCWSEASKVCIETGQPVDIECRGGIRIYAVPIWAGGEIIGSANFGYGDPPKDLKKLQEISERYIVSMDKLLELVEAYESRPFFIIKLAKSRLLTSAKLIGTVFERKRAEVALQKARDELEIRVQERTAELAKANKELTEQSRILESFFKSTITPLIFLDRDFNFIRVNEAYAKACQRDVSEFPGHNHFEFYPSDAKVIFEQVVKTKEPYQAIARPFTFPDHPEWGETYWDWTLTPILDERDETEYLVFSLNDVTERKRAEKALHAVSLYTRSLIETSLDPLVTISIDGKIMDVNRATELVTGLSRDHLIGSDFSDYFTEPEKAREGYRKVFVKGSVRDYPLAIQHKSGRITEVFYNASVYKNDAGEIQGAFAAARDVTERKEAENRIRSTNALLSLFSKKSVRKEYLDALVKLIQSWTGCRCVGIRVLNEKDYIPYESYVGFSHEFWESENWLSIRYDQCICIRVITQTPGSQDHPMMTPAGSFRCGNTFEFVGKLSEEEKSRYRGVCVQKGYMSVAVIPIRYRDKVLGATHLADEREGMVPLKAVEFLESIAPLIGEAMNRFNLEEELKESENRLRHLSSQLLTVQENERKRISREIHDGIGQTLTAIKFGLENKLSQMGNRVSPPGISIESIISLAQSGIEESRRIQMDLRPSILDDIGVLATIGWFTREFQKIYSNMSIEKEISIEEKDVPNPLKIVIFRVIQEAMNNIAKHSRATLIQLSLGKKGDKIELMIEDNGMGFDLESPKRGLGLTSMRERTELSGGTFVIESSPGKGTIIRACWPI